MVEYTVVEFTYGGIYRGGIYRGGIYPGGIYQSPSKKSRIPSNLTKIAQTKSEIPQNKYKWLISDKNESQNHLNGMKNNG